MCFTKNTFCCCHFPVWTGALIVGLLEIIGAWGNSNWGNVTLSYYMFFNSIWFALLFIPSLFYNGHYRKAVTSVYGISALIFALVAFVLTIIIAIYGTDISRALGNIMEADVDIWPGHSGGAGGMDSMLGGIDFGDFMRRRQLAVQHVENPRWWDEVMMEEDLEDDLTWCTMEAPTEESELDADIYDNWTCKEDSDSREEFDCVCPTKPFNTVLFGIWLMVICMWISLVLRFFMAHILKVFCHEAFWLEQGAQGGDAKNSHPCRQNC
jgi:hypothetical protein